MKIRNENLKTGDMITIVDLRKIPDRKSLDCVVFVKKALELIDVDNITVHMVDIPEHVQNGNVHYYGITEKHVMPNNYSLFLDPKASNMTKRDVLCHESIHIKQYDDGRLVIINSKKLVFDGKIYGPPYDKNQPHEKEAWNGQKELRNRVINALGHR